MERRKKHENTVKGKTNLVEISKNNSKPLPPKNKNKTKQNKTHTHTP